MVDCYTDYYFSDNSEGTGTASLIADHNILTTMSFIYTEREKTKLTKISMCQRGELNNLDPLLTSDIDLYLT